MNFLETCIYNQLWNKKPKKPKDKSSSSNIHKPKGGAGTMESLAENISRKLNPNNIHANYDESKRFMLSIFRVHVAEAARMYFGMDSLNDFPRAHSPPITDDKCDLREWTLRTLEQFIGDCILPAWTGAANTYCSSVNQNEVVVEAHQPDQKKNYAQYVLETGMTYAVTLKLIKMPNRDMFISHMKMLLMQTFSRSSRANYPREILMWLLQQKSIYSQKEAVRLFYAHFPLTSKRKHVPADLSMEWIVGDSKEFARNLFSNKNPHILEKHSPAYQW
jgi:hypothetical protein